MEESVSLEVGKKRNIVLVSIIYPVITFGIYYIYWTYSGAKEIKLHSSQQNFSPGLYTLGIFVPILSYYIHYRVAGRIKLMQEDDGIRDTISPGWVLFFWIVFPIVSIMLVQLHLNRHWKTHSNR